MESLVKLLADSAFLVGTVAFTQFTILVFRTKAKPRWLRRPSAEALTAIAISAMIAIALGLETAGLLSVGLPPILAIVAAPVVYALVTYLFWRGFGCRERLALADGGGSPFGSLAGRQA